MLYYARLCRMGYQVLKQPKDEIFDGELCDFRVTVPHQENRANICDLGFPRERRRYHTKNLLLIGQ